MVEGRRDWVRIVDPKDESIGLIVEIVRGQVEKGREVVVSVNICHICDSPNLCYY